MLEASSPSVSLVTELFKKPVVPASSDAAWIGNPSQTAHLAPSPMLVIARPYEAASKEEATLANMLKACGFSPATANIIQLTEVENVSWSSLRPLAQPTHVLLLGVPPAQLGIHATLSANTASEFAGVVFVWTSTIHHLTATEAARKSLWVDVLQPLFKKP